MNDTSCPVFNRTTLQGLHRQYCEQNETPLIRSNSTRARKPMKYNFSADDYDLSDLFQMEESELNTEEPVSSSTEIDLSSTYDATNKSKEEQLHEVESWKLLIHTYRHHIQQLEQKKNTTSS